MNRDFQRELMETQFVHFPLPLHRKRSLEAKAAEKAVLAETVIWNGGVVPPVLGPSRVPDGLGKVTAERDKTGEVLCMTAPVWAGCWPEGASPDGDYSNYGSAVLRFSFEREDWAKWNRLAFRVKPDVPGARIVHLNAAVFSDGAVKTPDRYFREGATVFDLTNHEWNDCYWELGGTARDEVTELVFYVFLCGKDTPMGDALRYDFADIRLQKIEGPEPEKGWSPAGIVFSTAGYWKNGDKTAIAQAAEGSFSLIEAAGG